MRQQGWQHGQQAPTKIGVRLGWQESSSSPVSFRHPIERVLLAVLRLDPVLGAARLTGAVAVLGDQPFKTHAQPVSSGSSSDR